MIAIAEDAAGEVVNDNAPRSTAEQIRLLVGDDHAAVRRGSRGLLADQRDFRVIDAVPSAEQAMSVAKGEELDVAVVDYLLGGRNGLEQAIFGMSRAGIAPVEIAKTLGISESGLESRTWEMLGKLETIGVHPTTSDRPS